MHTHSYNGTDIQIIFMKNMAANSNNKCISKMPKHRKFKYIIKRKVLYIDTCTLHKNYLSISVLFKKSALYLSPHCHKLSMIGISSLPDSVSEYSTFNGNTG